MGLGSAHERQGGGHGDTHHDVAQNKAPKIEKAGDPFKQFGHDGKDALHGADPLFRRESVATEYERAQALWSDFGDAPDAQQDETALGCPAVPLDFLNVPRTAQVDADVHRIDAGHIDIAERPSVALDDAAFDQDRQDEMELQRLGDEWLDALAGDMFATGLFSAPAVPAPAENFGQELGAYLKGTGPGAGSFEFSIEFRTLGEIDGRVSFGSNDHVDVELRPRSAAVRQLLQEHRADVERTAGSESGFDLTLMVV
jgi:hypothetical protein